MLEPDLVFDRFPDLRVALIRQIEVGQWLLGACQDFRASKVVPSADQKKTIDEAEAVESIDAFTALSFHDFELRDAIGAGAMGEVYRAFQRSLRRWVAIKVLKEMGGSHPHGVERFLREARAIASLRHTNIVRIYGIGRTPKGGYFLAMELIEGVSLSEHLRRGTFAPSEASRIVAEVADGISHAHQRGIIHRDLKPSNVLIEKDGHVVVTDLGLAKQLELDETSLSSSGDIVGTPQYMAPEQVDSRWGDVGPRTDVYGLGALLYALLVGRPPVQGNSVIEVLTAIGSGRRVIAPRAIRTGIPPAIETVCLKCLANFPAERYASAQEVAEALWCEVKSQGARIGAVGSRPKRAHSTRWMIRNRRAWACSVVAIVVVGALLTYLSRRQDRAVPGFPPGSDQVTRKMTPVALSRAAQGSCNVDHRCISARSHRQLRPIDRSWRRAEERRQSACGANLTEPLHAYLLWIGSEGCVEPLHPGGAKLDSRIDSLTVPASEHCGLPVRGPSGVEICLLILRPLPLSDSDKSGLTDRLRPPRSVMGSNPSTVLLDGKPPASWETASQRTKEGPTGTKIALDKLSSRSGSRSVGAAEPLDAPAFSRLIDAWLRQLPTALGEVRYVALPHLER